MDFITDISLWQLLTHLRRWIGNLRRAGAQRKTESRNAIRAVILAARGTRTYVRKLEQGGAQDYEEEGRLAEKWTALGFALRDLGIEDLAKRCDIKGRYWSDPKHYDKDFLDKADVTLERLEQIARQLEHDLAP